MPGSGGGLSLLALELPKSITPTVAGLTVGAIVGVIGFIAVLLLVGRGDRRPARRAPMTADQVVFIPPYGTMQRDTPLPPQAFATPERAYPFGPPPVLGPQAQPPVPRAHALPFVPSTQLSARAFAKMGYAVDADDERDAPNADPMLSIEIDMLDDEDLVDDTNTPLPQAAPVTVAPVVVVSSTPPMGARQLAESGTVRTAESADKSAPHPLGIIKASSTAMRAAPIADLSFDDGATEIGETYFDEPPQPRRRTDPPKIRPIAPKGPRFPEPTPLLPQVTPPPMRAVNRSS